VTGCWSTWCTNSLPSATAYSFRISPRQGIIHVSRQALGAPTPYLQRQHILFGSHQDRGWFVFPDGISESSTAPTQEPAGPSKRASWTITTRFALFAESLGHSAKALLTATHGIRHTATKYSAKPLSSAERALGKKKCNGNGQLMVTRFCRVP